MQHVLIYAIYPIFPDILKKYIFVQKFWRLHFIKSVPPNLVSQNNYKHAAIELFLYLNLILDASANNVTSSVISRKLVHLFVLFYVF